MLTNDRSRALDRAIRPRIVAHTFGRLALVAAASKLPPLLLGAALGEWAIAAALLAVGGLLAGVGLATRRLARPRDLQTDEGLVVLVAIFFIDALLMALPFAVAGIPLGDAIFESISAVTTTGLSTLASVESLPATILFTRAWMQWYGGLGIAILSVALLMGPGAAARRLGARGTENEEALESARAGARQVTAAYALLSIGGFFLLVLVGLSPFDALVHDLAAISTGGFSSHDASLAGLGGTGTAAAVLCICFAGAMPLPVWVAVRSRGWRALARDPEVKTLAVLILAISVALIVTLAANSAQPLGEILRNAPLLAVSAQTTTGFSTISVADTGSTAQLILCMAMLAGGSLGSTAGGIKLFRLLVALQVVRWMIRRTHLPQHAVVEPRIGETDLDAGEIQRALGLVLLFLGVAALSWLPFVLFTYPPVESLFEVVSALATVGLSSGISRPALEGALKAVLCVDMLLGRLEILAVLVFLSPRTWFGRRRD
jgi:trk system potassium uptake protein TrkH